MVVDVVMTSTGQPDMSGNGSETLQGFLTLLATNVGAVTPQAHSGLEGRLTGL